MTRVPLSGITIGWLADFCGRYDDDGCDSCPFCENGCCQFAHHSPSVWPMVIEDPELDRYIDALTKTGHEYPVFIDELEELSKRAERKRR